MSKRLVYLKIFLVGTVMAAVLLYSLIFEQNTHRSAENTQINSFSVDLDGIEFVVSCNSIAWNNGTHSSVVLAFPNDLRPKPRVELSYEKTDSFTKAPKHSVHFSLVFGDAEDKMPENTLTIMRLDGSMKTRAFHEIGVTEIEPYQNEPEFKKRIEMIVRKALQN